MNSNNVSWLTTVPVSDGNFKLHLGHATVEEIEQAIEICKKQEKCKSKITALERELKRRSKDEQSKD